MSHADILPAMADIDPVQVVLDAFGGVTAVARIVNRHPSAVSKWQERGRIPSACQQALLAAAQQQCVSITAEDLIRGRPGATT
jgi:hypothetical protein